MFLKRLIFVNWGNVPDAEFEFGPVNLFSGANGSGKTTAADAIQTVMTAAHENLFHYNPGQEESTQRGRGGKRVRTLSSYVLGCDDGSYARLDATDGYLAAIFHPTEGESAEAFTALMSVRAWLDQSGKQVVAREEQLAFFILPTVQMTLGDLQRQGKTLQWVLQDELPNELVKRFGKRCVERYDQKRAYLRRLYGALRGKSDSVSEREAMAAARAFSRFMAYKPVSSIHQFVADEVLERKDLGEAIRSASTQLKTIHGLERDAQGLKDSALLLEQAGAAAQRYLEAWTERVTLDYTQARSGYLVLQTQYLQAGAEREELQRKLADNASEQALAEQRRAQAHDDVVQIEARRQGVAALKEKDALERERDTLGARMPEIAKRLLIADQQLQTNAASVRALLPLLSGPTMVADAPQLTDMQSRQLLTEAQRADQAADFDWARFVQQDLTEDLALLEKNLDEARQLQITQHAVCAYWKQPAPSAATRRDQLAELHLKRQQRYQQITQQCAHKQQDIERLQAKQAVYPAFVERALAAIRTQCPQADARVLCDYIEVTDARWQSAIEGYMGNARFSILVDAAHEAEAIRVVRSMSGRDNHARVIQGDKALRDAERSKPPTDSIVHVLAFSHRIAHAYVVGAYGNVVRVDSAEALRHSARGVTADGMGSGNYAMFRCDMNDADLVFGAAARERALKARQIEFQELQQQRQLANTLQQESARAQESVDHLQPALLAEAIEELMEVQRSLRHIDLQLARLDTSEHVSLDQQLAERKQEEASWRARIGELREQEGEAKHKLVTLAKRIENLSEQKESAQEGLSAAESTLRELHGQWPEFDLEARFVFADSEAKGFQSRQVELLRPELDSRLRNAERALDASLQQHNQKCRPDQAILYSAYAGEFDVKLFRAIIGLRREIDRVFNILKNNLLVEKLEQLKAIRQSFNNSFVEHVCQQIYQAIVDGKRQLELLNRELVNHRFGSDREQFRFDADWQPEYHGYWKFFEEVVKSPPGGESVTLFEAKLSVRSQAVRDELMQLLLGSDEQKSLRELERIADYRNYQRYEIYKEVEGKLPIALSEYGTGSGGQLETPAYIIRAASITSALRYAEGANHLRMVLVDEAFSKMDETRSRQVIDYLTSTLGLQLIFIMPTSKCGPFMDLISNEFVFAKVPSALRGQLNTRVLVDRKQCNQERIKALWAQHRRTVAQQAELDFLDDIP
jgi:energy-coupling factor transporter ATP-binding protein EcfA2